LELCHFMLRNICIGFLIVPPAAGIRSKAAPMIHEGQFADVVELSRLKSAETPGCLRLPVFQYQVGH